MNEEVMQFIGKALINDVSEIEYLRKEVDQLTNNWNEVRKHIKDYLEEWENSDDEWVKGKCDMARDILYDMEEIKDGNK